MKFSIRWIFEHIIGDWQAIGITKLVDTFNKVTAEIERYEKRVVDLDSYTVAQVIAYNDLFVELFSPEHNKIYQLNLRESVEIGSWYLLTKISSGMRWANYADLGGNRGGLLPAAHISEEQRAGSWKKSVWSFDYIIDVDNKSITHRPDLWGHRGIAREVAAYYGLSLKSLDEFLVKLPIKREQEVMASEGVTSLCLQMNQHVPCQSIAATQIFEVDPRPSDIALFFRLAPVDSGLVNVAVDITNYVMLDLGSPMHVFDANAIKDNQLEVRMAKNGERLTLLDGETITLTDHDLVIADSSRPLSLAGIMGGAHSGVTAQTKNIVAEAGCFDAATIRRTAAHHKKRTDASARFEKSLDASLPVQAIARYLALAQEFQVAIKPATEILLRGHEGRALEIELVHDTIEKKLGVSIAPERVRAILTHLEFAVAPMQSEVELKYTITVPSFRASKDIRIKEDIIEEIARFYGYGLIVQCLPIQEHKPWDMNPLMRLRQIKNFLAYGLCLQEVYNYALYDENFLRILDFNPNALEVLSPVSEHWRRLVTSLFPHLLKDVQQNAQHSDQLRFFEWGRTWIVEQDVVHEKRTLAGIMLHQKEVIDFYSAKQEIERLCSLLGLSVLWQRFDMLDDSWFAPYESAYLMVDGLCIGRAGKMKLSQLHKVASGDAFIFEFDADFLYSHKPSIHTYEAASKFPEIIRDISMFVPVILTVNFLEELIKHIDARIYQVSLIDFFVLQDNAEQRAVTIRFIVRDTTKTLTKDEVDVITNRIIEKLQSVGAMIR